MNENLFNEYKQMGKEDVDQKSVLSKEQLKAQFSGNDYDLEVAWNGYQEGKVTRELELEEKGQHVNEIDISKEVDFYELGYAAGEKADINAPRENDSELAEKSGLEPETGPFYDWVWGYHSALNHQEVVEQQMKEYDQEMEWRKSIDEQREAEGHDEPCPDYSMYY